jgi:hypothetical protein
MSDLKMSTNIIQNIDISGTEKLDYLAVLPG